MSLCYSVFLILSLSPLPLSLPPHMVCGRTVPPAVSFLSDGSSEAMDLLVDPTTTSIASAIKVCRCIFTSWALTVPCGQLKVLVLCPDSNVFSGLQ